MKRWSTMPAGCGRADARSADARRTRASSTEGLRSTFLPGAEMLMESSRGADRQRPKQQDVDQREHRGRRTNAQRERDENGGRERSLLQQQSDAEA